MNADHFSMGGISIQISTSTLSSFSSLRNRLRMMALYYRSTTFIHRCEKEPPLSCITEGHINPDRAPRLRERVQSPPPVVSFSSGFIKPSNLQPLLFCLYQTTLFPFQLELSPSSRHLFTNVSSESALSRALSPIWRDNTIHSWVRHPR